MIPFYESPFVGTFWVHRGNAISNYLPAFKSTQYFAARRLRFFWTQ